MLDDVIAGGDLGEVAVARYVKADLLAASAVRLRNTVAVPRTLTDGALACFMSAHAAIEPLVANWLADANRLYAENAALAADHPELAQLPVLGWVLHTSIAISEHRALQAG
jgi:hypothetical protein